MGKFLRIKQFRVALVDCSDKGMKEETECVGTSTSSIYDS